MVLVTILVHVLLYNVQLSFVVGGLKLNGAMLMRNLKQICTMVQTKNNSVYFLGGR
jgi:hypothetical protein